MLFSSTIWLGYMFVISVILSLMTTNERKIINDNCLTSNSEAYVIFDRGHELPFSNTSHLTIYDDGDISEASIANSRSIS